MALGNLNEVTLMGNLGRDPEIRRLQDGTPVANLSIATSESWRDKATGERREKVEWHRVVVWGKAEGGLTAMIDKWLQKGDKVYIRGQLQTRKWTDQGGVEKFSTEVHVRNWGHTVQIITSKRMDANRSERGDGPPIDNTPGREESLGGAPVAGVGHTTGPLGDDEIPF